MKNTRATNEVRDLQCMQPWGDEQYELALRHAERLDALEAENERLRQLVSSAPAYERDARVEIERLRAELEKECITLRAQRDELLACASQILVA